MSFSKQKIWHSAAYTLHAINLKCEVIIYTFKIVNIYKKKKQKKGVIRNLQEDSHV